MEKIKSKENKINEIKSTIPIEIKLNEKIISVIFNSFDENIYYSIICKNTDNFKKIEKNYMRNIQNIEILKIISF